MKKEFLNAKVQTSTFTKTRNLSKLLLAVLLSIVLFGGAMFLLFANHTAPVSTALAANNLSTLPTSLTEAPVFTYNSSSGTLTGTDQTINGYNFKDDIYYASTSTNLTIGGVKYPYAVTLKRYTPTTPTQVVIPSQIKIDENTYQVVINSTDSGFFANKSVATNISFASVGETKVLATNCQYMFYNCSNLTSLDLSNFETKNVTNMRSMFSNCSSLTSLDLSSFDTSNVTSMAYMFDYCSKLTSLDLSNFDTSNVTDMGSMFSNCSSLTSLDVSNFNTSNVTGMRGTFMNCTSLTSLDLSNFDTSKVTDMWSMFSNCSSLTSLDLSSFDTSKVTNMYQMFYNCSSLTSLDLSNFDLTIVTNMFETFSNCTSLETLKCTNMKLNANSSTLFSGLTTLKTIDLSNADTSNVTDMGRMFYSCVMLTSLDISNFDMTKITSASNRIEMFSGCKLLKILKCTNMKLPADSSSLFSGFSALKTLDLSNADTSNVTNMGSMFSNCSSLTSLDLSSFDTRNVTDMSRMFAGCYGLESLDLSSFVFKADCNVTSMFGEGPTKSDEEMAETLYGEEGVVAEIGTQIDSLLENIDKLDENDEKIEIVAYRSDISKCKITETRDDFLNMTTKQKMEFYDNIVKKYATIICVSQYFSAETEAERAQYLPTDENISTYFNGLREMLYQNLGFSANLGTYAQIQSIVLPASVNGLSIALPASYYAVNGTDEYAYTTLQGYNDLTTPNGTSYEAGTTLQNKALVPETPTETGLATDLLLALSGAVVVAMFAVAIVGLNKKKRVVTK